MLDRNGKSAELVKKTDSDLEEIRRVLDIEARALLKIRDRLTGEVSEVVDLIAACTGKVIITGVGKSGHIARKFASTLSSTGTPALFLHPSESSHGDLGVISTGDIVVAISYGGESIEMADLLQHCARKGIPLVAMTGHLRSRLAQAAQFVLDCSVEEEACPLGLAPTASSTASLALADAVAMAVLRRKGFRAENFAEFHPGGSLGRKLLTRVRDVMHTGDAVPLVSPETPMKEVISVMTRKEVRGIAGVVDDQGDLIGVLTDGDIRRHLEKSRNPLADPIQQIMSTSPKTIEAGELAEKAVFLMEQFRIQSLFVVDSEAGPLRKPVGLLHLQDLLYARIR